MAARPSAPASFLSPIPSLDARFAAEKLARARRSALFRPDRAAAAERRSGAPWRERLFALVVSLGGSTLSTFEYIKVSYEKCFAELPGWHQAHLANQAAAPLQYRILSYAIPELLARAGVPIGIAYIAERGAFLCAANYVFFFLCRRWLGTLETLFACTCLTLFYALSSFPHIQPAEEINLFAFALGLWFVRERYFGALLALVTVAAFNKETVGFLIPFYFAWEARATGVAFALRRSAALAFALAAVYVGIRVGLGTDRPYLGGLWQIRHNASMVVSDPFLGLFFVVPSLAPAAWIALRRRRIDPFFVLFLPSLLLFVAGHLAISRADEFRTYAPLALMTIPASILLLKESVRRRRAAGPA